MLARMLGRTIILGVCALLLLAVYPVSASSLSAREYTSLRRSLKATSPSITSLKSSDYYVGRNVEITGKVDGLMKCGESSSIVLNCGNDSLIVKTGDKHYDCISNGNTIRVLVKVGPDFRASLSDLQLLGAAYDYDITKIEQQSAKTKKNKKQSSPKVLYRGSNPNKFYSAQRGVNISSRAMSVYSPYKAAILRFNPNLSEQQADVITKSILTYSERYNVDPRLVIALIITESGFRPTATSRCGAMGLCQLMPGTARGMGVSNAYDPEQSIEASIRLVRGHLDRYGDLSLALSAYNAGPGAVKKHGGVPPYRETRNYIAKVSRLYKALCGK